MADVTNAAGSPGKAKYLMGKIKAEAVNIDITDYGAPEDVSGGLGEFDDVLCVLGLGATDTGHVWEYEDTNENIVARAISDGTTPASGTDVGSQTALVIGYT